MAARLYHISCCAHQAIPYTNSWPPGHTIYHAVPTGQYHKPFLARQTIPYTMPSPMPCLPGHIQCDARQANLGLQRYSYLTIRYVSRYLPHATIRTSIQFLAWGGTLKYKKKSIIRSKQCLDISFWKILTIISMNIGNKRENSNRFLYHMCKNKYFNNFSPTNYTFCLIVSWNVIVSRYAYRQKKYRDTIRFQWIVSPLQAIPCTMWCPPGPSIWPL